MKKTTNQRLSTLDLVYIAVGAALIAICSWISVPLTVPFTLQTFAVFFLLTLFGGKRGTLSVLVYILLGAVGLPVFSGMQGGIGVLAGNTGGYILGFVLTGLIFWGAEALFGKSAVSQLAALTLGLAVCYLFGTLWFMLYTHTFNAAGFAGEARYFAGTRLEKYLRRSLHGMTDEKFEELTGRLNARLKTVARR